MIAPSAGFDRDVTIHDFTIGEDRIDLSWLRVEGDSGYRELELDDLDLAALSAELGETGSATLDLSAFATKDGDPLGGALKIVLAGGATVLTEEDFGLTPSPDWLQELHLQALLVPMEQ